jgi:hypothetical protein
MAHAVQVGPEAAALGGDSAIQESQAKAEPIHLALIQGRQRVALLHGGRHDGTASQSPSASTVATRLHPTVRLAASKPRGPRTERHFTVWVSMMVRRGFGLRPTARRRNRARSRIMRPNRPSSVQRRNQP